MTEKKEPLKEPFNAEAPDAGDHVFVRGLRKYFDQDTTDKVMHVLRALQVPIPQEEEQYMPSQAGILLFSNTHGVMIRIETPTSFVPDDEGFSTGTAVRANDSAWVLQPLATVKAGKALVEVVPGIHAETDDVESRKLYWKLWADGYTYWDERLDNVGRLPAVKGQEEGTPVVLDRLATHFSHSNSAGFRAGEILKGERNLLKYRSPVRVEPSPNSDLKLEWEQLITEAAKIEVKGDIPDKYVAEAYKVFRANMGNYWPAAQKAPNIYALDDSVQRALNRTLPLLTEKAREKPEKSREEMGGDDPQEILYGDLRRSFTNAWPATQNEPDAAKMAEFWSQVAVAKEQGRLVNGWQEKREGETYIKAEKAPKVAAAYETLSMGIGFTTMRPIIGQVKKVDYKRSFPS